jgi:hypothetical protein
MIIRYTHYSLLEFIALYRISIQMMICTHITLFVLLCFKLKLNTVTAINHLTFSHDYLIFSCLLQKYTNEYI